MKTNGAWISFLPAIEGIRDLDAKVFSNLSFRTLRKEDRKCAYFCLVFTNLFKTGSVNSPGFQKHVQLKLFFKRRIAQKE